MSPLAFSDRVQGAAVAPAELALRLSKEVIEVLLGADQHEGVEIVAGLLEVLAGERPGGRFIVLDSGEVPNHQVVTCPPSQRSRQSG